MASESSEEQVSLPADLEAWLERKAADLGVDRETVLVQLLAAYRAADELDDDREVLGDPETVEPAVRSVLEERLPDIAGAVEDRLDTPEPGLDEDRLEERLDEVETDFAEKLDDVRQRVIQVKRETDEKTPLSEFDTALQRLEELEDATARLEQLERRLEELEDDVGRLDGVETELDGVESELAELRDRLDDGAERRVAELTDRLDDVQEKLQTVAWVVRDMREDRGSRATPVDEIKRTAARQDISRARCQNCGEGVDVALLTDPSCPHCDATLGGVEPSSRPLGLGSASLTVAAQIEAGADADDELDDIDTSHESDRR